MGERNTEGGHWERQRAEAREGEAAAGKTPVTLWEGVDALGETMRVRTSPSRVELLNGRFWRPAFIPEMSQLAVLMARLLAAAQARIADLVENRDGLAKGATELIAALAAERTAREQAEQAIKILRRAWGGHGHWDREGTHGANCPACIQWREACREVDAIEAIAEKGDTHG